VKRFPRQPVAVVIMVIGLFSLSANAGRHPVPLDAKIDSAKCLECHDEKAKGKSVHTAVATGCTSCHEIRVSKDVTRTKLTATSTGKLCISCHDDKDVTKIQGHVHEPAVRDCVKCHDPHTSANKNQLLKAASGDKNENLCLTCHTQGLNVPTKGSRHAALDGGCDTCHTTHKNGDTTQREFRFHLTKATPALCLDCHDAKDAALAKAHNNQPIEKSDCLSCHDPHQSNSPKLMQAFVHSPFEGGKDSCATCHEAPKNGKVVLTQAESKALCLTCHDEQAKKIESAKVQHPGAAGDCIDCHSPHASKTPGLPKTTAVNICLNCHSDQAEQHKKRHLHQPAFEQGCATCHEPHGGDNPKLLRAKSINSLCLECHGPDAQPVTVKEAHLITIFDGKVRLPETYFSKVPRLPIKYGLGHPVDKHPVTDQMEAGDMTKVRVAVNCGTCHQPHASAQPNLLVKDQANNMAFCASCHKDFAK